MLCYAHVALCRGLEKSLSERHGRGMARARHGRSMASVNQTRPRCVNQMGKTQSKPLAARHGRGTAWARHGMCELALIEIHICTLAMRVFLSLDNTIEFCTTLDILITTVHLLTIVQNNKRSKVHVLKYPLHLSEEQTSNWNILSTLFDENTLLS
jgi:hypothetical protein